MPKSKEGKTDKKVTSHSSASASSSTTQDRPIILNSDNSIGIKILAKPGAKQNGITGLTSEGVGVQIAAPPVEGEANTELLKYFAKVLGVRKSDIELDKGSKSRCKVLRLSKDSGLSIETVVDKLQGEVG
ncbi:hypothetical protein Btru_027518 [Bulinus truncatus]|nr:hypothetical protein Btru_027518 [Bulinus truncatus]